MFSREQEARIKELIDEVLEEKREKRFKGLHEMYRFDGVSLDYLLEQRGISREEYEKIKNAGIVKKEKE